MTSLRLTPSLSWQTTDYTSRLSSHGKEKKRKASCGKTLATEGNTAYRTMMLGFLGMTDVETVRAEGTKIPSVLDNAIVTGLNSVTTDTRDRPLRAVLADH